VAAKRLGRTSARRQRGRSRVTDLGANVTIE
jgi:hypothetical protein